MKKFKKAVKISAITVSVLAILSAVLILALVIFTYKKIDFKSDERLFECSQSFESTTFYAFDNKKREYSPIQTSGALRKIYYPLDEISKNIKEGFVSVEDRKFYSHSGVDLKRTLGAAVNYVFRREKLYGASTITQQVIKNISGDNEIKLTRKLSEIIRARHIEKIYTKDEILELYLNVIPMGENIFGVGAASRAYFGKEPSELSVEEAAALIGITNAPTAYNPYDNFENCLKKRNIVLSVMLSEGVLNDYEYKKAKSAPLSLVPREEREDRVDSWFCEVVIDDVVRDLSKKFGISESAATILLLDGGFSVYTTMDKDVQSIIENYFENTENFPAEINSGLNFAMAITDSVSGDLVGVAGSVGKKRANRILNHAKIPHTPGSTLKPIALYAPLIDEGRINAATVFDDVPVEFWETEGEYREYPRNSPAVYDGLMTVKDALRLSKNTVAVRLCLMRTPRAVFETLSRDYGFETLVERETLNDGRVITDIATSPMALGQLSRGVSIMKLAESYGVFCSDGVLKNQRSYTEVFDYSGKSILKNEKHEKRIMKPETARIMNTLLSDVVLDGTAGKITLSKSVETAGKTGTSGNNRDKMFVGYTPYYTAGIWCGYDRGDGSVVNLNRDHLEVWDAIMNEIHIEKLKEEAEIKKFPKDGLIYHSFCKDSGGIFSDVCVYDPRGTRVDYGYFTVDNCPDLVCNRHVLCLYDAETKAVAGKGCPRDNLVAVALVREELRSFPKEIYVTDAEYIYRDVDKYSFYSSDPALPFFYDVISEGEYVGKSKREKQFNSGCNH